MLLAVVGTDAVDKDSGPVTTAYVMTAPADNTAVVSPLTTLVQQTVESSNVSSADAEKIVKDQTGLTASLFADYTKTRDGDTASAAAGLVARTIVVTTQQQIVPGDIQIEIFHHFEVQKILFCNEGNRDIIDVDLILLDEIKQKIEGPFKYIEFDLVFHNDTLTNYK